MQASTALLTKAVYEPGMKITYDPVSKRVLVAFRGRISVLPDAVESEADAVSAGESYCVRHGWNPAEKARRNMNFRSLW